MKLEFTNIGIECTDLCNMRCIMCNQSNAPFSMHGDAYKNGFLSTEDFSRLIKCLCNSSLEIGRITPFWGGESTLHPYFGSFMSIIFEQNIKKPFFRKLVLNTNGLKFDEHISNIFLNYAKYINENNLDEYWVNITFSLDAVSRVTFEKIKGAPGISQERILKNIRYLIEKRKSMGIIMPNITFQFIILQGNEHETGEFLSYWEDYLSSMGIRFGLDTKGIYVRDKDLLCLETENSNRPDYTKAAIERKRRTLKELKIMQSEEETSGQETKEFIRRPCFQLWNMCIISRGGSVIPCCKDNYFSLLLGNIKKNNLEELWLGERLKQFRLAQIRGEFEKLDICNNCMLPPGGYISDAEVVEYLELIHEQKLIEEYLKRMGKNNQE